MTGYEYEEKCAKFLEAKGFTDIKVTQGSGDQGIDVLAKKNGKKYGIQCKYYEGTVGNKAVQEAFAGASFYDCDVAMVMTNASFSKSAEELARKLGVELWNDVNAITFYEATKAADGSMTPEEKESAEIARLEKALQERYRQMHGKFPPNEAKDAEVAQYVKDEKASAENTVKLFTNMRNEIADNVRHTTFRNTRDPLFQHYKEQLRLCCRNCEIFLHTQLEKADQEATRYVKSGVSEKSVKLLVSAIRDIYYCGYFSVSLEEKTVGEFKWKAKHKKIFDKWTAFENQLPSVLEQKHKAEEARETSYFQKKLTDARRKIKNLETDIAQLEASIAGRDGHITELLTRLREKEAEIAAQKAALAQKREELEAEIKPLKAELCNTDAKLADVKEQIRTANTMLAKQSVFAFKAKKELKQQIESLEKQEPEIASQRARLSDQIDTVTANYQSLMAKIQEDIDNLDNRHRDIQCEITKSEKAIEDKTAEKRIVAKQAEIKALKASLPDLEKQVTLAHKNYLKRLLEEENWS